ncbi:radical SAM protein [bacterium]|nr:radical SAM protein [candidate division CSSED10-310 bacterium]
METRIDRLVRWSIGEHVGPYKVELYPTNRCNLSCSFCWKAGEQEEDHHREMAPETVLRLVRESAALGTSEWFLCGAGEPLMAPRSTLPAMEAIKAAGMKGILNTNGFLVTPGMIDRWVEIGWEDLHFSIDSWRPREHDLLRGVHGSFIRVDAALTRAFELRRRRNSYHPYLVMISVMTRHNYAQIRRITAYALSRGINKLIVKEMIQHPHALHLNLNALQYRRFRRLLGKARETAMTAGMEFEFQEAVPRDVPFLPPVKTVQQPTTPRSEPPAVQVSPAAAGSRGIVRQDLSAVPCFEFWLSLFVYPNGEAHCGIWGDTVNVEQASLAEIWFNGYFAAMRERLVSGEIPAMCRSCGRFRNGDHRALLEGWRARVSDLT